MDPQKPYIGFVDGGINTTINEKLDLNKYLIKHPAATFFVRINGSRLSHIGIMDGDILVVDKSLSPSSGSLVLATINEEFQVMRFHRGVDGVHLFSERDSLRTIKVTLGDETQIWGVVLHVIHTPAQTAWN